MKSLIVYFSHPHENYVNGKIINLKEGNTSVVAKKIQKMVHGDIFEILPLHEYPLPYDECTKLAKKELQENQRPKIKNMLSHIDDYDIIYLGFPNWWNSAPMIIKTFLEEYDLKKHMVKAFCTHEGSGIENCMKDLQRLYPTINFGQSIAIFGSKVNTCDEKLEKWLEL